jgi:glycosyltransferase involved in cell wall biosynthesis
MSQLISILLPDLTGGGAERVNLDLAHEFNRQGYTVEFVLMRFEGELLVEALAAFRVFDLGTSRARQVPLALAGYLRRNRPDALLVAMWPLTVLAPIGRALSRHRCKLLVSEHAIISAQYKTFGLIHNLLLRISTALGYRMADARVGVSTGVVRDIAQLAQMPMGRFDVIYNPVPSRPNPGPQALASADSLWAVPPGVRILSVGRFKAVKNHPLLLRAFAKLAQRSGARLMFLGTGAGEVTLRALAEELGIADQVIFAGFQHDPTPFYRTADLFVLSSDYEGFGNVIVEALACGTPVVSTNCPCGPAEILDNGRFGRLVPVGDADALGSSLIAELDAQFCSASLIRRAADFSPEIAAYKYLKLINLKV